MRENISSTERLNAVKDRETSSSGKNGHHDSANHIYFANYLATKKSNLRSSLNHPLVITWVNCMKRAK